MSIKIGPQEDVEAAVQKLSQEHLDEILVWDTPLFWRHSGLILGFARANRLPVMSRSKEYVDRIVRARPTRPAPTLRLLNSRQPSQPRC